MKKKSLLFSFAFLSVFSFHAVSQSGARLELGTPESLMNDVSNQYSRSASTLALPLSTGETATISLQDYFSGDNKISMHGTAAQSVNSSFILKGDRSSLYGYLVLHDTKKAFEITTTKGIVSIQEVNIAKIYPDLYETEMKPPVLNAPFATTPPVYSPMAQRQAIHIGPYNNEDITKLQSKPGSAYVFYLNQSAVLDGTTPKNGNSKESVFRVWQCVSDQYSMYNLNITTDVSVYNAAKTKDVLKTGIINFVDQDGRSNAPIAAFGTTSAGTLYRDASNGDYGYGIGMTCAHEMGHEMGMSHDGGSAQSDPEYFFGLPAVQWCPIMGNYWYGGSWKNQLFTWSKGEYNTATQTQDDLKIMNVNEKVPYVVDDNPSSKAIKFGNGGVISASNNWGQIEQNTDTDAFTFEVVKGGGKINLKIDPLEYLRQLDVAAKIVNASGTVVSSSNLAVNRSAEFKDVALPEGIYTLVIEGGAELTPQTGFSKYSSLGYYGMEGTVTGAIVTGLDKVTLENSIIAFPNPTTDVLTINYANNNYSNAQITVSTVTGQTVFSSDKFVRSIDMSDFAKGIYLLKITVDGESCVKKISKL
jgi:hypothetical protein